MMMKNVFLVAMALLATTFAFAEKNAVSSSYDKVTAGNSKLVPLDSICLSDKTGRLGMLWTSWVYNVYTQGVAYSESGTLDGPWEQEKEPVTPPNFGHSMLFQTFDGQWLMSLHSHYVNEKGEYIRVPHLFKVNLDGDKLVVEGEYKP